MEYRLLGRTGIRVSEIGFGAWGIGRGLWQGADDAESLRALHKAVDLGVNLIDTALAYGSGHSERLVGKFLKECKQKMSVATKIPPKNLQWPPKPGTELSSAFPYDHIVKRTEQSLKNLAVDAIDIQQFHVWMDDWTDLAEWYEAISKLKEEGKIRFFGISINEHQPTNALKVGASGKVDAFQVLYNIFDQTPEEKLFSLCEEKKIGVIVRVPFDEGALTGNIAPETKFPKGDFRNNYFRGERKRQVFDRVTELQKLLGDEAPTLPELALRFCLQPPAVSTVIPGMRTAAHVAANCEVSDGRMLSARLIEELRKHKWDKNFYS